MEPRAPPGSAGTTHPQASRGGPRAWVLGARPATLFAALAPLAAGGGLAAADGAFAPLPWAAALACAVLIQVGTNLANDYGDFRKGADTRDRLGSPRVTQAGLLRPSQVRNGAVLAFAVAVLLGLYLVGVGGWPILLIGIASIAAGILYTAGPWPFGYHGLGDPAVFLFFGLVAVGGTYYVQALAFRPEPLLAGAGVGALVTAILVVNNLRDIQTDARAGKRTLAVRLGRTGTQAEYAGLLAVAAAVPPAGVLLGGWSPGALLALAAFLGAPVALRTVFVFRDPRELNPALGRTAVIAALYGFLLGAGANL